METWNINLNIELKDLYHHYQKHELMTGEGHREQGVLPEIVLIRKKQDVLEVLAKIKENEKAVNARE